MLCLSLENKVKEIMGCWSRDKIDKRVNQRNKSWFIEDFKVFKTLCHGKNLREVKE